MRIGLTAGVLLGALLVAAAGLGASSGAPPRGPLQLGFTEGDDWEPALAVDRHGHVYALWAHYGPDPACPGCASPHMELQVSDDGGRTWGAPRPLTRPAVRQDDPQLVVDPVDGRTVYAAYMEGEKASMYVARSDDFGRSWHPVLVESLERGTDKDILAVRGPHVYLVYNAVQKIYASVSHDGGRTWSVRRPVANTNSKLGWSLPSGGTVDSRGHAHFAWSGYEGNGKPSGDVNLYVTTTRDGGETWSTSRVDVSGAPPPCGCGGWAYWGAQMALAVDGGDRLYALYNAGPAKFARNSLYLRRSDDGGRTWGPRREVSDAPAGTNAMLPAVVARGDGDVRIAWQDDRAGFDAGGDDPAARWNTWYRTSVDGGATWSALARLSQYVPGYPYKLPDGHLEPYGDYLELDLDGAGRTHTVWGEGPSYAGPGNVWYTMP